jgi:diacylglycerol kinase (ATP)
MMGLAPAGRCNDFARVLGVSTNAQAMADVLTNGTPCSIDLGRVNDRYFCTVATVGVDAEVSSYVDAMRVPLSGTAAYLYGALCVLGRYQPRTVRIAGRFGVIEQAVFLASCANTSFYGGSIPIAPGAVPIDGLLDLCIIDALSTWRALRLIPTVLKGRHRLEPEVRFIKTKRLSIETGEPLELWADGERIGRTPATIEVAPGAVEVMLPAGFRFSQMA